MKRLTSMGLLLATLLCSYETTSAQDIVDTWKYTLRRPPMQWREVKFDDSSWTDGNGGFGTYDTPGSRVGKVWTTDNIWLRKTFTLDAIPQNPAILLHHDEECELFLNGKPLAQFKGYITDYKVVPFADGKHALLKSGINTLAVHCHQTGGGQFIDVHIVNGDNVPKLPEPHRDTKPYISELITTWGEEVTPQNVWTEYPRPAFARTQWTNLNGHWNYAITAVDQQEIPSQWDGQILVPFSLESKLSGVQRLLDATEALWYRRTFEVNNLGDDRLLLNFEAVDYRSDVFINGKHAASHTGGNTPFQIDVTDHLHSGDNTIVVRVEDETEAWQLRGKQVLNARGIWYTQVSGIWQTVWMERVSAAHISDVKIHTNAERGTITIAPVLSSNAAEHTQVQVTLSDNSKQVASGVVEGDSLELTIKEAKLWTPETPALYDIKLKLVNSKGKTVDTVQTYAGIRSVGKVKDAQGHWRFTLNGKPVFHWGPLDQGWWPDGLLTPPSDEGMRFDIEYLKAAGFNMIRKHIKVEPRRYYYHCDKLGMMVWQDQVSGGRNPSWTRLQPNPEDAQWPNEFHDQYMIELQRMIGELENHPSIVCWVPFNEAWGQHRTKDVGQWTVQRDPSRLVNIASGGNFWPVGDIVDMHNYPHPAFPFELNTNGRFDDFVKVIGEFGGHGWPVQGHLWNANMRNWGYGNLPQSIEEYQDRYLTSLNILNELRGKGISGGVYTQTTDVEGEINGLMTYDRKVIKIDASKLADWHTRLFE